ncbi:hypothetical protein EK21DRAFT_90786 [Setomelanomma holmii]|uniref:Ankyrin n=1 Tax=Setomelanomma holmii TaxID=210430 RepID=A0A9P4H505_9PLEO|nr:hypothetical protein EK21DRAFT_90786 [Setomelanomma holmii]
MEVIASVITIAELIWKLLHKTIHYIKEVKSIREPVEQLLERVKSLLRLTKAVKSTYALAEASLGKDHRSLRVVSKALAKCENRLKSLEPLAVELASLDTQSWSQKLTVKRRLDRVKVTIEDTRQEIRDDMQELRTGLTLLPIDLDAHRRPSDAPSTQQPNSAVVDIQSAVEDEHIPSIIRTFSDAETLFGPEPDLELRRLSTAVTSTRSRPSISSTVSQTPSRFSARSGSIASASGPSLNSSKSDWAEFHFHIAKCAGDPQRLRKICDILHQYSEGTALARSTDSWDRTPLHVAAQKGDVVLARTLVEFGGDIDAQDTTPSSVLDMAVSHGHRPFVAFLLDLNVKESNLQPENAKRLKEMKRAIHLQKKTDAMNGRNGTEISQTGVVTSS